jgi:hypothetical protein
VILLKRIDYVEASVFLTGRCLIATEGVGRLGNAKADDCNAVSHLGKFPKDLHWMDLIHGCGQTNKSQIDPRFGPILVFWVKDHILHFCGDFSPCEAVVKPRVPRVDGVGRSYDPSRSNQDAAAPPANATIDLSAPHCGELGSRAQCTEQFPITVVSPSTDVHYEEE